jgi:peptidoglycan/xylan/chitin deacetylase (PgdA/CDA1 family)
MNRLRNPPAILLYHRVLSLQSDPQWLAVAPERFDQQLKLLREEFVPISLSELLVRVACGDVSNRAVVVTFDDGYADNLEFALPLLEKHRVPATFFITSGQINTKQEFWWDELEAILLMPNRLPEELSLRIGGKTFQWSLDSAAVYSPADWERHRSWNATHPDNPTERHSLYQAMCGRIRVLPLAERWSTLQALRAWAGTDGKPRPTHHAMTRAELARLATSPLCEVGAHTVHHPSLGALPVEEQKQEITLSKQHLEAITGKPVKTFSYPFGTREDHSVATVELAKQAGFHAACSNFPGWIKRRTNAFQLPRFVVRDWSADELRRQFQRWLRF